MQKKKKNEGGGARRGARIGCMQVFLHKWQAEVLVTARLAKHLEN